VPTCVLLPLAHAHRVVNDSSFIYRLTSPRLQVAPAGLGPGCAEESDLVRVGDVVLGEWSWDAHFGCLLDLVRVGDVVLGELLPVFCGVRCLFLRAEAILL